VGNGAVIAPVVVFSVTTGLMVNTIAADAWASAYKRDAALYVGNMLVMVLRLVERLEILGCLAIPRDGVVLVVGRTIAWKSIDASLGGTVGENFCVLVDVLADLVGRVLGNLLEEQRRQRRGLDSILTTKHVGVAVVVDDTVVGFGGVHGDALVIVAPLREERRQHRRDLDSRLTTKHGIVDVLCGGRAIAWRAMDASMNDTMVGVCLGNALAVLVGRVLLLR